METKVNIDGIECAMKCSGATPVFYRRLFNHDLFQEFVGLQKFLITDKDGKTTADLNSFDFGIVERLAYTMAYQADRSIGSMEDWLDQFDHSTAILDAMPDILTLYMEGLRTSSEVKKKSGEPNGR